ncbi:MAG: polymer-forming cytoskeletal protein [Gammaproteobacteria bacterium]|nr:polymer-forming cytoskeletal protein [Gammaproteobacteria bacterium]
MKNRLSNAVTTLVGADATIAGNIDFDRGCHVSGTVKGDVSAPGNKKSELTVAQTGRIEGNAKAARMLIQGTVVGDLSCSGTVTLTSTARVKGSIEYGQLEIEKGAVIKGQLLTRSAGTARSAAAAVPRPDSRPAERVQASLG